MADQHQILTDKSIVRLPFAGHKQYKVRDSELPGFFLLIGKRRKSFMAQGEFWRDGSREFAAQVKLGDFGDMSTREARGRAKEVLGAISRGQRPGEVPKIKPGSITLQQAWERYRDAHMKRKGRNPGTIKNYRDHMERLFEDWLDKPLARLGRQPTLVVDRHDKITKENGPYIANGSMRSLRAVYNHARKSNTDLPPLNPVSAIDWNKEHRRKTGMGPNDISGWLRELRAMENPLRREFHLLTLLSGSRPTALKKVRIEHIDLQQRIIHIPRPKGGEEKAFDIPLSRPMIRCIIRAIRLGRIMYFEQAKSWLFPAESEPGHLVEHKEERNLLSKWGNDLRQSYRTLAQAVGVSELDIHLLMNHSLPGVNAGYITRDRLLRDHLRQQQQRISELIVNSGAVGRDPLLVRWLGSAKVEEAAIETASIQDHIDDARLSRVHRQIMAPAQSSGRIDVNSRPPRSPRANNRSRAQKRAGAPRVAAFSDPPPQRPSLTDYDRQHLALYVRPLDAAEEGADWTEVVRILFGLDPERDGERARSIHDGHLARARWIAERGYRDLLRPALQ